MKRKYCLKKTVSVGLKINLKNVPLLVQMFVFLYIFGDTLLIGSLYLHAKSVNNAVPRNSVVKHYIPGKNYQQNRLFITFSIYILFTVTITTWFAILLLRSGDIHQNPGPETRGL